MNKLFYNKTVKELDRLGKSIFSIKEEMDFISIALRIFNLQYQMVDVYREYVDLLHINPNDIRKIEEIPFLPIDFFKYHRIIAQNKEPDLVFYSSGTTGMVQSKHYITDNEIYKKSLIKAFSFFYGNPSEYSFLALLPGYLEREGSSLIYMVKELMNLSQQPENGFFLNEFEQLKQIILKIKEQKKKYILIGVTYALLDFAHFADINLSDGIVIETGGMKGKRKEIIKQEVHQILKNKFKTDKIHSEYGMTELLSQAYSKGDGLYHCPPWMKVLIRDVYDPFKLVENGVSGGINVIDLANLYSCSFIETKDLGKLNQAGQFEVLGRFDNSDIRGCNLLVG